MTPDSQPHAVGINHTGVSVSDMDRSIEFYTAVLGLELVLDLDVVGHPGLEEVVQMAGVIGRCVFLDVGETRLELWQYTSPAGQPLRDGHIPADKGVTHVAFTVSDVDAMWEKVTAAGYTALSKPLDLGLHKTMYMRGPDNEYIELLEDRTDRAMLQRATARTLAAREAARSAG